MQIKTWQTFGHNQIKSILEKQLAAGAFPHAYLFLGPEGVGKKMLAREFAGKILNFDKLDKLETNPDFIFFEARGVEQEIDRLRELVSRLSLKPALGGEKVAIIDNAQNLLEKNSNVLLKTIEEPTANTVIILIAGQGALLPTIVSRCQVLRFNLFSKEQLKNFAHSQGPAAEKRILFDFSFGRIGRLKELARNPELLKSETEAVEKLKKTQEEKRVRSLFLVFRALLSWTPTLNPYLKHTKGKYLCK